jgi:peroxiredoxin
MRISALSRLADSGRQSHATSTLTARSTPKSQTHQVRSARGGLPQNVVEREIEAAGVRLVAISPRNADHSLSMSEKHGLKLQVLTDGGNAVARQYGLVFSVEESVRKLLAQMHASLPDFNGHDSRTLPVPGTFIVDRSGAMQLAYADANFSHRLQPSAIS